MPLVRDAPKDAYLVGTVAADGTLTIRFTAPDQRPWLVSQVSIEMLTAPAGATCMLRKRGLLISPMIPNGDAAGGDPPITLYQGEPLTVEWAGCTAGQQGTALIIYHVMDY